jgi:transcriptional/translational regulatory protein YebC/TACO1
LTNQCIERGQQKIRGDGIVQYSMQHTGGIFFVYKNDSTDKILKEEITFDVEALQVEG